MLRSYAWCFHKCKIDRVLNLPSKASSDSRDTEQHVSIIRMLVVLLYDIGADVSKSQSPVRANLPPSVSSQLKMHLLLAMELPVTGGCELNLMNVEF